MEKLEFGRAKTPNQAILRLPERSHPFYRSEKGFEELAHIKEWFIRMPQNYKNRKCDDLPDRFAPLGADAVKLMEELSFRRKPLYSHRWMHIEEDFSPWDNLWEAKGKWRWWEISKLDPEMVLDDILNLVLIEFNSKYQSRDTQVRSDEHSEFQTGFASEEELQTLIDHLDRFSNS